MQYMLDEFGVSMNLAFFLNKTCIHNENKANPICYHVA